ncbi:hypothetical protein BS78_10G032800 [Paspalum vaginatum]|nr:hypothetical protein BS78_10G032800 [Paspalum vaginatum]
MALNPSSLGAGDTLKPPNYITSQSGDFAFGFRALDNSSTSNSFLLAIWFRFDADAAAGRVVWFAADVGGSGSAVVAGEQSNLSLTAPGQLSLTNAGLSLWNPYIDPSQNRNNGSMLVLQDNGNLQFLGADGKTVFWESFCHPILPFMFPTDSSLRSRASDMDFSAGRFRLYVQRDGNIVLYMTDMPTDSGPNNAFWSTGTCCDGNTTLIFDVELVGHLYYIRADGTKVNLTTPHQYLHSSNSRFFYQHATLDPDGIFRVYVLPKNTTASNGDGTTTAWSVVDLLPSDGCKSLTAIGAHGMCGPNSYCVCDTNKRLDCECPSGYTFLDTKFRYKGCTPSFVQDSCDGKNHSSEFKSMELPNTYWASTIYYEWHQSISEEQCQDLCLNNCLCAAALFDGNNRCWEAAVLTAGWKTNDTTIRASIKELHRATNGFSKLLGQGGFGKVYHGIIRSLEPHDVAVKELRAKDEYQEVEFENELQSIGRIHHKNLVRLVGYCKEGVHRMLVFEFMPGGSLRDILFRSSKQAERPPWSWRAEAAMGVARGLEYLHYGCATQIIHCDIKPDNILLDAKRAPKITDFGIARLLSDSKVKQTITHVRGTLGYLEPEWFNSERKVDIKVDVFSFGIVLLEMICCKKYPDQDELRCRDDDDSNIGMPVTLRAWVSDLVRQGNTERIVQGDDDALKDLQRVERFARITIWCVVWMMEGTMDVDPLPDDDPRVQEDFAAPLSPSSTSGTHHDTHSVVSSLI